MRRDKRSLGRRTFLRGLGACVALPLMESLLPESARAEEQLPPKRLLYWYVPNGINMAEWTPAQEGAGAAWQLSNVLAPLAPHKDDILVVSGLDNLPGEAIAGDAPFGAHYQQTAAFLTCAHVNNTPFAAGKSIDQVCADAIGYVTPHRSLQLGVALGGLTGACSASWPCAYVSFVSWANATTPIAQLTNPRTTFETLFGPGAVGVSQADFLKRKAYRLKILDVVNEDAQALRSKLGRSDQIKLDKYLTAVDETEMRVSSQQYGLACDPGDGPDHDPATYLEHLDMMVDIMVLAFQCDITRIMSFMTYIGGASHGVPYDWVDYQGMPINESFHDLSHHGGVAEKLGKVAAINAWEVDVFGTLIQKLKDAEDVDGSRILDNSLLFFSSEVSDGNEHSIRNMPVVVAGSGQGAIQTNRHLRYSSPNNTYAELHIALAHAFGVPVGSFGDGAAPLPGILS
jgi:hypothetical protein